MSTPEATCWATTSSTAWAVAVSKRAASILSPCSRARMMSSSGFGRGRLPVCVVRMRSVEVFMDVSKLLRRDDAPRFRNQVGRGLVNFFHQSVDVASGHGGHFDPHLVGFGEKLRILHG